MKFFHPQIQLARKDVMDALPNYFLHVVTFLPRTSFRADDYTTDDSELADKMLYKVQLNIRQDAGLPDFDYITPVVHTIDLGAVDFPGGQGNFEVEVVATVIETVHIANRGAGDPPTTTKTGGPGTVSTSDADGTTRPVDSYTF